MKKDDRLLWSNFLSENDHAYEYIYREHIQHLFLYGMTFTGDPELVKDCIQDVFIRIYQNRRHLGQTDNIRLYLLAALKNTILNAFKKQNTYTQFINSLEFEETNTDTAEEKLVTCEYDTGIQEQMAECKSLLTNRQQEIIHYRFVEELSIEEIAQLLQINYQSVANILQRALKKMRSFYLKNEYKK
ncbi:MAG: RNA polymerase sigma factor [Mangrovibacterium sp.]